MSSAKATEVPGCSYLPHAVPSERSSATIKLGQKLVAELGLEESADTLGRWMAHHVGQLIEEAKTATGEQKQSAEARLREMIPALWTRRRDRSPNARDMTSLEAVRRTIQSLDPSAPSPHYAELRELDEVLDADEGNAAANWRRCALLLDLAARNLIKYCLVRAAEDDLGELDENVQLAAEAEFEGDGEPAVHQWLSDERKLHTEELSAKQRQRLERRRQSLKMFVDASTEMIAEFDALLGPDEEDFDDIDSADRPKSPEEI